MHTKESPKSVYLAILGLIGLVSAIYFPRMAVLPIAGEEGRWATGAMEMLESGDWIVTRQQGEIFPERPPMSSWGMAVVGLVRGHVDVIAIRLPSVLAVVLTSLVVFWYAQTFLSTLGAFAAGAVYATMGQVLEIGRMGESEAVFTLFLSAALLVWHHGYYRQGRPAATWTAAYGLAALAALVKGPQAPVYFVAAVGVFLCLRRDWRYLVSWTHALGIVVFASVIAAWQVPYLLWTNWDATIATWAGLAGDRIRLAGLAEHIVTFPLETFACLLPWSPLLILFAKREFREAVRPQRDMLLFLVTAIVVTYPSVWFSSGARGRYFMPLYPCVAVLIGLVIQRCAEAAPGTTTKKDWNRFAVGLTAAIGVSAVLVLVVSFLPQPKFALWQQPLGLAVAFCLVSLLGAGVVFRAMRHDRYQHHASYQHTVATFVSLCVLVGLASTTVIMNVQAARWNDLRPPVSQIKEQLPHDVRLISFTPIDHRFAYHYQEAIEQHAWPASLDEVPKDVEYFCMNHIPGDTPDVRAAGRGRSWGTSPGTLPFAWEPLVEIPCDRRVRHNPGRTVIVGRILRPDDRVANEPQRERLRE